MAVPTPTPPTGALPGRRLVLMGMALLILAAVGGSVLLTLGADRNAAARDREIVFEPSRPTILGETVVVAPRRAGTAEVYVGSKDAAEVDRLVAEVRCTVATDGVEGAVAVPEGVPRRVVLAGRTSERVGVFAAEADAIHRISCSAPDAGVADRFVVAPRASGTPSLAGVGLVGLALLVGAAFGIPGIVMLSLGIVRHNRAVRAFGPSAGGPAGPAGGRSGSAG